MNGIFWGMIEDSVNRIIEEVINFFVGLMTGVSGITMAVLESPIVNSTIIYTQTVAFSILTAKIAFEAWTTYILRTNGDPDADPAGLLMRSTQAVVMIVSVPWLVKWVYQFGTVMAIDISNLPALNQTDTSGLGDVLRNLQGFFLFLLVGIVAALIIYVLILIQNFIRAAELAVAAISGSFMALGLTNRDSQMFSTWWREIVSISLSQVIQIVLIRLSFYSFFVRFPGFDDNGINSLLLFIAFLWVAWKSPSIIKNYTYSSGAGRVLGGAVQSAGSAAIMRRLFTKV